jgi:class 3 adenylate cyclase/YHS domain-containing protein
MSSASDQSAGSNTFVFADLAGFTALTEAHGDIEAIEIASRFTARVRGLLPEHGAEQIKTIGDEVMIRVPQASDAVGLGLRITRELAAHGSPPVRVGMHSGPAVKRGGDWFGATINLASRVADAARPGEVLITEGTRRALRETEGFELIERGSRHLKNIPEPVRLHRAVGAGEEPLELEIDPVCRMAVDPKRAAATRHRIGLTYFFCSPRCAAAFSVSPRRYTATGAAARAARRGFLINLTAFLIVGTVHLVGWIADQDDRHGVPPMLFLFIAWAALLAFHFRVVRRVL